MVYIGQQLLYVELRLRLEKLEEVDQQQVFIFLVEELELEFVQKQDLVVWEVVLMVVIQVVVLRVQQEQQTPAVVEVEEDVLVTTHKVVLV